MWINISRKKIISNLQPSFLQSTKLCTSWHHGHTPPPPQKREKKWPLGNRVHFFSSKFAIVFDFIFLFTFLFFSRFSTHDLRVDFWSFADVPQVNTSEHDVGRRPKAIYRNWLFVTIYTTRTVSHKAPLPRPNLTLLTWLLRVASRAVTNVFDAYYFTLNFRCEIFKILNFSPFLKYFNEILKLVYFDE